MLAVDLFYQLSHMMFFILLIEYIPDTPLLEFLAMILIPCFRIFPERGVLVVCFFSLSCSSIYFSSNSGFFFLSACVALLRMSTSYFYQ